MRSRDGPWKNGLDFNLHTGERSQAAFTWKEAFTDEVRTRRKLVAIKHEVNISHFGPRSARHACAI